MKISHHIQKQAFLTLSLVVSIFFLVRFAFPLIANLPLWEGDYVGFWTTGRLFLRGENPYSLSALQELRAEEGLNNSNPYYEVVLYPPWAIPVMALMGLFEFQTGQLVFIMIYVAIIFTSTEFFWQRYGGSSNLRWLAHLLAFLFAPSLFVIGRIQMAPLVLLGIVGVLFFLSRPRRDWLAGASLYLVAIKPHLPYLFLGALLLWVLRNRRWGVVIGGVAVLLISWVLTLPFNSSLYWQYLTMRQARFNQLDWATPTIGNFLRSLFGYEQVWLQVLPSLIGLLWLGWYWTQRKGNWDWWAETPLLLLASVISATFIWTYDQVILIPALIAGAVRLTQIDQRRVTQSLLLAVFGLSAATIWLHRMFDDAWFVWFAPTLLIWYGAVRKITDRPNP